MGRGTQILLGDVERLLRKCAPGHEWMQTTHHIRVTWRGKTFHNLPKGAHGRRPGRAPIQLGWVKKLVEHLELDLACVTSVLPQVAPFVGRPR